MIKLANSIQIVDSSEILYIKADGSYAVIKKLNGEELRLSKNLKSIAGKIAGDPNLIRCHKSYVVNMTQLSAISTLKKRTYSIRLNNGESLPLSLSCRKHFIAELEQVHAD